jgi:carboxymethylenebutenolidase
MNKPYLYSNTKHRATKVVIVLPEIFGITDFIKNVTDRFADEFSLSAFALDHFYSATGKVEVFDYYGDYSRNMEIMNNMKGEDFYKLFQQALGEIQAEHPAITEFVVVGFCFGGRLAYLAGMDERVSKLISFYGGQPHAVNYYEGKSPVEALTDARGGSRLKVLAFYGGQDESIPADDREKTKELLAKAGIRYVEKVYEQAGHAYFNDSRPERYNAEAAAKSWEVVKDFLV